MSKKPVNQKSIKQHLDLEECDLEEFELQEVWKRDAGKGTSQRPSDCAFELPWHENDPAWAWLDAVYAADVQQDPSPLLALLSASAPDNVMPFVKDLFDRKLGPLKHKRGPKTPLWQASLIERAARMVGQLIKEEGLTVEAAVDRILEDHGWIAEQIKRDTLIAHYTGKSEHGRRAKKRRP